MAHTQTASIAKSLKRGVLGCGQRCGLFSLAAGSAWRRRRLLILCYHGIALRDEHEWNPELYMSAEDFEKRMALVQRYRCHVLTLAEGVDRLYHNRLPERSVTITFDDGTYDFYRQAWPILQRYDFPATVYLTTFYNEYQEPVWPLICSYMLWKRRMRSADFTGIANLSGVIDLRCPKRRSLILHALTEHGDRCHLLAPEKNQIAMAVAERLGLDYEELRAERILQIMTRSEVAEVARRDIDIQLHTHRHRTPLDAALFRREINDNRIAIENITRVPAVHFCYPSGVHRPQFLPWLESERVVSATTCDPGMASARTPRLLLPRLVDHSSLSDLEFEGWLCGVSAGLPRRRRRE